MSAGMRCTRSKDPGEKKRGEKEKEKEKERGRRTRNSSYCRTNWSADEADTAPLLVLNPVILKVPFPVVQFTYDH